MSSSGSTLKNYPTNDIPNETIIPLLFAYLTRHKVLDYKDARTVLHTVGRSGPELCEIWREKFGSLDGMSAELASQIPDESFVDASHNDTARKMLVERIHAANFTTLTGYEKSHPQMKNKFPHPDDEWDSEPLKADYKEIIDEHSVFTDKTE